MLLFQTVTSSKKEILKFCSFTSIYFILKTVNREEEENLEDPEKDGLRRELEQAV